MVRRALGELRNVLRAASEPHLHLRDRLVAIGALTVAVDLVCAVLAYFLERHAPGTEIKTFQDALFWTSTQLLTVSSSLKNPVTGGGKLLDVIMEIYAITVVASLAGSFGAFFMVRSHQRSAAARDG